MLWFGRIGQFILDLSGNFQQNLDRSDVDFEAGTFTVLLQKWLFYDAFFAFENYVCHFKNYFLVAERSSHSSIRLQRGQIEGATYGFMQVMLPENEDFMASNPLFYAS